MENLNSSLNAPAVPEIAQTKWFNSEPLLYGPLFREPLISELTEEIYFKYANLHFVETRCGPYTKELLRLVPIRGKHKFVLVDVKVHHLKKGDYPAIPGWHIDCVKHYNNDTKDDVHHLFVTGQYCLTRFLKNPIELDIASDYRISVPREAEFIEAPSCQFVTFTRNHLHDCQMAKEDETRYLIRITETDIIKPNNQIRKELYYG